MAYDNLSRRTFLAASASMAAANLLQAQAAPASRPNIIVILADDLGRGDYSAFGTPGLHTPNIDRILSRGMTFENFYTNSPVCSPTRASILTGCYPDRVGVPGEIREENPADSWGYLSTDVPLLPKLLKQAGYHSAIVGKWNLGTSSPNLPTDRGFDHFHGFLGDMMDDYFTHRRNKQNYMRENEKTIDPQGHATDLFTDWACAYLDQRKAANQPFFLYLAYNAPHDPLQPKPDWLAKVKQREPNMPEKRAKFIALVEHLDDGIGKVLDKLDQTGLAANTLVILTSDNGGVTADGSNVGPWRGSKGTVYEGGIRVPFGALWPGKIAPGSRSDRIALTMDIFPTALEAAGVSAPSHIDGQSLLGTFQGQGGGDPNREVYFVRREGGQAYGGKTIEAVRKGDWKILQNSPFAPLELYNLKEDPRETKNLAQSERRMFATMSAALRRHIQRGGAVPWQRPAR